jgi:hypothetical protein
MRIEKGERGEGRRREEERDCGGGEEEMMRRLWTETTWIVGEMERV